MVIIGLILILIAALVGVLLFIGTSKITDTTDIGVLGATLGLPPLAILLAGALTIVVFWLGWALLRSGLRRSSRQRKERKEQARLAEEQRAQREREMQEGFAARERALAEEQRAHEADAQRLRGEADSRVAEQHESTEIARRRAEVAENKLPDDQRY